MTRFLMLPIAAALLAGCANLTSPLDPDYQFGDLTGSLLATQAEYCATADPYRRAALAAVLRSQGIGLPPGGACTRLVELLPQPDPEAVEHARQQQQHAQQPE